MVKLTSKERILGQIRSWLCSQNPIREQKWRMLVESLRRNGRDPMVASDALPEFLSVAVESGTPGTPFLSGTDYHRLCESEKIDVNVLYQECLRTAMYDFPHIFQAS